MKKSVLLILAVLFALTLLLVACNDNKDPHQPSDSDKGTTAPETEAHVHSFDGWTTVTEPTCTEQGKQQRKCDCGKTETQSIDALGHAISDWNVVQEPTCESSGYQTQTCANCNQNVREDIPPKGHSFGEWEIITDSTCTEIGQQKHTCSVCNAEENAEIPAKGHSFGDYVQTLSPTCTEQGEDTRTCTVCAYAETVAIPANGHSFVDYICSVCNVVAPEKAVQTVKIANDPLLLPMNTEVKLDIQIYPADSLYTTITYTIDERNNSCGATITEDGILSCTQLGSVRIRVTVDNVSSAYVTFNVPKEIHTAEEFDAIRNDLKGHYILCNNIDLSAYSTWTPIGYATKAADGSLSYSGTGFQGQFDGNGYTISGVNIDLAKTDLITVGLFGFVDTSATVSNLKVEAKMQGTVTSAEYIGTLTGVNYGVVKNCEVSSELDLSGALYVGGIAGQNNGNLTDCTADVIIKARNGNTNGYYVGGVAGQFVIGNMDNNTAKANIEITSCYFCYVGGITGNAYGSFSGTACDSTIVIASADYSYTSYVGGVVGKVEDSDAEIAFDLNNVAITGSITVKDANKLYVGGITGYGDVFSNCINDIDIRVTSYGDTYVGGIAGYSTKISGAENNGEITVTSPTTVYVGGIAGRTEILNDATNYKDISVNAATTYLGGVAGKAVSATNVYNYCYEISVSANSTTTFGGVIGDCTEKIENSYNTANLTVSKCGSLYMGGIVGFSDYQNSIVSNAVNSGTIKIDVYQLTNTYVGGIAGIAATVKDSANSATVLHIQTSYPYGSSQLAVGGLCGASAESIENSYSYADITALNNSEYKYYSSGYSAIIGGLAGSAKNVSRSYATGDISATLYIDYINLGGLIGNLNGTVSESYARGSATGVTGKEIKIGGLVAYTQGGASVQNCYAAYNYLTANITSEGRTAYIGGLVAHNSGAVADSYAMNYINTIGSGSDDTIYAGGVIGYNDGQVTNSYSASATEHVLNTDIPVDIDCTSNLSANVYVGGFVGYNSRVITNCYASAEVIGRGCYTGGFVGYQEARGSISYALALAPVNSGISGQTHTGGFAGNELGTYENCIFSTTGTQIDASNGAGGTTVNGIVGKSETDLLVASNLSGFDTSVWTIVSGSLPTLTLNSNWKVYNDGYDNFNVLVNVANPDRQYVKVSDSTVEIKFESNWDLPLPETVVLEKGSKITMIPDLTAEGYFFVGWFTDAEFTKPFTVDGTYAIAEDMVLYAYFRKIIDVPKTDGINRIPTDSWTVSGSFPEVIPNEGSIYSQFIVAGGSDSGALLQKGAVGIGEIDLSKYSKIIIYYGMDTSQAVINRYNERSNNRIMLTSVDTNGVNSPQESTIIASATYTLQGWSLVALEIDLSDVDYNGPVYVTYDTLPNTFMLIGAIGLYDDDSYVYNGETITLETLDLTGKYYTVEGVYEAFDVGDYSVTLKLNKDYCWSEGNIDDATLIWTIGRRPVAIPQSETYTYSGEKFSLTSLDLTGKYYTVDGVYEATDAGEYTVTLMLDKNCCWNVGDMENKTITWTIEIKSVAIPTDGFYIVSEDAIVLENIDPSGVFYTITGDYSAAAIGDYSCVLSLLDKNNSIWADGTTDDKTIDWSIVNGLCDDGIVWQLYATGELILKGTGAMCNYSNNNKAPWNDLRNQIVSITISNGITNLGESAFHGCSSLTSITIPDSITSIGYEAFYNCTRLTSITIPDSVTSIGMNAFLGCTRLTSITIPDSVTRIGIGAFFNCSSLTSITIPNGVTSISSSAFSGCTSLTSITIPDSVRTIGDYAFVDCGNLTGITIPDSVTSIGACTFYDCSSLTSITIPDSVTSIDNYAFSGCSHLTDVFYAGTQKKWAAITIGHDNTPLHNATIHYNWTGEES